MKEKKPEPYGLDPLFERMIATALCCKPRLFGLVGKEIEVVRIKDPTAVLAIRAAQKVAEDFGHGPSNPVVVVQRARRWQQEGSVKSEDIDAFVDMIDETVDEVPTEAEIVTELIPVLRRHIHAEVVRTALDEYSKHGDFDKVVQAVNRARKLGIQDRSTGSKLSLGALDDIARMRAADRLSTGVLELDLGLGGGLSRGKLGLFVAGAKVGKSMWLIHQATVALRAGLFVLLATLELSEEDQQARLIANITEVPIDAIIDGTSRDVVSKRLGDALPSLGTFRAKFFPAKATTFADIVDWVKEAEDEETRKVDLLIVDYIDKLGTQDKRQISSYEVQGQAAEDMRLYAHGRGIWGWTASQPKRREGKDRGKRIEIDDIADSINKGRVADLILSGSRPSEDEIEIYVAGNRNGKGQFSVGPFPHNFSCGQILTAI